MRYANDNIVIIIIQDPTGRKLDKITSNQSDKKTLRHISKFLKDKYDIDFSIDNTKESIFDV